MIGTTAALVLGGLTAGSQIAGSVIGSKSAKKASEQQIAAAERAMQAQTPLYNQALSIAQQQAQQGRADLAPYAQQGGQGLTALTSLLGLPAPAARAPMGPAGGVGPGAGTVQAPGYPGTRTLPPGAMPTGHAVSRPGTAGTPGTVLLRAPNGQTQAVSPDQVDFFVARGATRV